MKGTFIKIGRLVITMLMVMGVLGMFLSPVAAEEPPPDGGCCEANAPDFCMPLDCPVDLDLFLDHGAGCCDDCQMSIDFSQVDSSTVGSYPYTVTCSDGVCVDTDTGYVDVESRVCVEIIEWPKWDVPVSTYFGIKATIENWNCSEQDVTATVVYDPAEVELISPSANISLGMLRVSQEDSEFEPTTVAWTFHCLDEGDTDIKVVTNHSEGGDSTCFCGCYDWAEVTIHQMVEPALVVEVDCPCEICTNCDPDDEFTVRARVMNVGDVDVDEVELKITTSGPGSADIDGSKTKAIGLVPAGSVWSDWTTPWDVECTSQGDVVFRVTATGENSCTGQPLTGEYYDECTTHQENFIVNVNCVIGLIADWEAQSDWNNYDGNLGTDLDMSAAWACSDTCPQEKDTISGDAEYGQYVAITANVTNCSDQQETLWARLVPPTNTVLASAVAHVVCAGSSADNYVTVEAPDWTVQISDLCGCCEAQVTWILRCTGASAQEVVVVEVTDGITTWTNQCDDAKITQEDKAHLRTELNAYVESCMSGSFSQPVDGIAVGQGFDVKITVHNDGDADADNVTLDVVVSGGTDCAGVKTDVFFDTVNGNSSKYMWLSDIMQVSNNCTCTEESLVTVSVDDIEGWDENTCERIPEENIDSVCPLYLDQCVFDIELMNPQTCEDIFNGDYFAVKAQLVNCGTCDFEDIDVTLHWEDCGEVSLHPDYVGMETQRIPEILANPCGPCDTCSDNATIFEITWMVKCDCPGDVTFWVCAESNALEDSEKGPHLMIKSQKETIHQVLPETCLEIDILSPDAGSFYATGQEFAVTAEITNSGNLTGYPAWANDVVVGIHDLGFDSECGEDGLGHASVVACNFPESEILGHGGLPTWDIGDIPPFESVLVTWTLQCDESGLSPLVVGVDASNIADDCWEEGCCPFFDELFDYHDFVMVWQYPAAHLEVEITDAPMSVDVCDEFTVSYTVTNTGEADATEVDALLSVTPEGSVRPAPGDNGYLIDIGTIPGRGAAGSTYEGTLDLHCKAACESTLTVEAMGLDEYGWHKKQACANTGSFTVTGGFISVEGLDPVEEAPTSTGWTWGIMVGDANGLIGPFIIDTPMSATDFLDMGEDISGQVVATGYVIPHVGDGMEWLLDWLEPGDSMCDSLTDLLGMGVEGQDVIVFAGKWLLDPGVDASEIHWDLPLGAGEFNVINGVIAGAEVGFVFDPCPEFHGVLSFLGGTYCSSMAAEAGRPIDPRFLDSDSVTVKQLLPVDLAVTKDVDNDRPLVDDVVEFTVTVTNNGPSDATGVVISDSWCGSLAYDSHAASIGSFDYMSGNWTIGKLSMGATATLLFSAEVTDDVEAVNTAMVCSVDQTDWNSFNDSASVVLNADPVDSYDIGLTDGWNLISMPLIPDDTLIENMFGDICANIDPSFGVYEYDTVLGTFPTSAPVGCPAWAGSISNIVDGKGYWVVMTAADTLTVEGVEIQLPPYAPPTYSVTDGWNLIGFKSVSQKKAGDYLAAIDGDYTVIYRYSNGVFSAVQPGDNMRPGEGYWVAITAPGTIYP